MYHHNPISLSRGVRVVALAAALTLTATSASAAVWYVKPPPITTASGASWGTATSLDNALANAVTGDEIRVKEGTYYPTVLTNPSDPNSYSFVIAQGVTVRGGFLGFETTSKPLGSPLLTFLDGNTGSLATEADNAYHVVTITSSSPARLDGFTVQNGYAYVAGLTPPSTDTRLRGAGIYIQGAYKVTLANLLLHENNAHDRGGAIFAGSSNVVLKQATVLHNTADYRGGAVCAQRSKFDAANVIFQVNGINTLQGGALFLGEGNSQLANCSFLENSADQGSGGAAFLASGQNLTASNCTFADNRGSSSAPFPGAAYTIDNASNPTGSCTLNNSIVWSWNLGVPPLAHFLGVGAAFTANSSDLQAIGTVPAGTGNISVDPDYVIPSNNVSLSDSVSHPGQPLAWSPCLDVGNVALLPADFTDIDEDLNFGEALPMDRERSARISPAGLDMGAFEGSYASFLNP